MSELLKPDFATQAGHWYRPDGTPAYTVIGKNGKERPTTLRDAKEHGLYPSVTTIMREAAAPGLERWKINNAVMSALTLTRNDDESDEDFISRVIRDSEEQSRKAREKGTAIHGAIEKHYLGIPPDEEYLPHVKAAAQSVKDGFGNQVWSAERSFSSELGFGGKLDLSSDSGKGFVIDFKTTEKSLDGIKTWPEHEMQLGAYRMGLGLPEARCAIVYVSTRPDGGAVLLELPNEDLERGWLCFRSLLDFWMARKSFKRSP